MGRLFAKCCRLTAGLAQGGVMASPRGFAPCKIMNWLGDVGGYPATGRRARGQGRGESRQVCGGSGSLAYRLEVETAADWWEVEALYDLCFGPGRTALSSYRLRDGVPPVAPLCLCLRDGDGTLAAVIRYWPARIGAQDVLLLGPIAVHPTRQGEGLGGLLIHESLAQARRLGWQRVLLVGDAPYYGRFGFSRLDGVVMPPPTNPDRVLGLALTPGAWTGLRGTVGKAG